MRPPLERYRLWCHEHTSLSSLSSFATSSNESMDAPEAVRNHEAIGSTPLSANGGVVVTDWAHRGHVFHRTHLPCSRKALMIHVMQNRCLQGSSLYQSQFVSPGMPLQ